MKEFSPKYKNWVKKSKDSMRPIGRWEEETKSQCVDTQQNIKWIATRPKFISLKFEYLAEKIMLF